MFGREIRAEYGRVVKTRPMMIKVLTIVIIWIDLNRYSMVGDRSDRFQRTCYNRTRRGMYLELDLETVLIRLSSQVDHGEGHQGRYRGRATEDVTTGCSLFRMTGIAYRVTGAVEST